MPSVTTFSPQVAMNKLAGNSLLTAKTEHEVFNTSNGSTGKTLQQILNENKSAPSKIALSPQAQLYAILKTPLSLTGPMTEYSEQTLLNLAFAASTPILTVIGK
jgi:hypothetical protein